MKRLRSAPTFAGLLLFLAAILPTEALAHCDSMDGPVVRAAQEALATNRVELALVWVQPAGEAEIRAAFDRTMRVRRAGGEAQDLADYWFFETLVRVHRAGEGEPYTGLKPAGSPVPESIARADHALETGTVDELAIDLSGEAEHILRERFESVVALDGYEATDVEAGRRYVRAYTEYMHFVEALHALLEGESAAHWSTHDAHAGEAR